MHKKKAMLRLFILGMVYFYHASISANGNTTNSISIESNGDISQIISMYNDIDPISDKTEVFSISDLEEVDFDLGLLLTPTLYSGSERFDFSRFYTPNRIPIELYELSAYEKERFHRDTNHLVQDMPIKLAHNENVYLSSSHRQFFSVIEKIFAFEKSFNQHLDEYNAFLTIDQRVINANQSLRTQGWHVDGMHIRSEGEPAERISHVYTLVVTDSGDNSTEYTTQGFPELKGFAVNKYNLFRAFDYLIKPESIHSSKSGSLYYMDAYTVHRSPIAVQYVGKRTFLRVQLTPKVFNRIGNTINPAFGDIFSNESKGFPVLKDPVHLLKVKSKL